MAHVRTEVDASAQLKVRVGRDGQDEIVVVNRRDEFGFTRKPATDTSTRTPISDPLVGNCSRAVLKSIARYNSMILSQNHECFGTIGLRHLNVPVGR